MLPDPVVIAARLRLSDRGVPAPPPADGPLLSVVVPVFDEQETLPELYRRLTAVVTGLSGPAEIVFVDDGSRDRTPQMLADLAAADPRVVVARLSRNFGHQAAVTAGLDLARGRAVAVMDADLQDPPEVLPRLLERWRQGAEVVYAVRTRRKEGPLKRLGYWLFYRLLRSAAELDIPLDSGDFCLMDRSAADALNRLPERARFVRGLRAFVGFRQAGVEYERDARHAGRPKYTLRKLAGLAAAGVWGFTGLPIRLVGYCGAGLVGGAVVAAVAGGAATAVAVLFVGGLQLLGLAAVGEYVRRIFVEVTGRPPYILREVIRHNADSVDRAA